MDNKEIENGIRDALRTEFPDTAFSVSYDGEDLSILVLGGFLKRYGDMQNFPDEIQNRIQDAVFSVAPIFMIFDTVSHFYWIRLGISSTECPDLVDQ